MRVAALSLSVAPARCHGVESSWSLYPVPLTPACCHAGPTTAGGAQFKTLLDAAQFGPGACPYTPLALLNAVGTYSKSTSCGKYITQTLFGPAYSTVKAYMNTTAALPGTCALFQTQLLHQLAVGCRVP